MPQKRANSKRTTSGRRKSIVPRKRPNVFIRILQRLPGWSWWIGGVTIVAIYIYFFYYIFVSPFGFRWRALYGEVNYPQGYEVHGIDVSHHQGRIDWGLLRDNGQINERPVRFVMVKATEGASKVDENFSSNFYNARQYGFIRGAYHFYSVYSSAKDQAEFFIRHVKLAKGDLPPVLDVEHKPKNQTDEEFRASVLEWLRLVEKHYGIPPIIYTYHKFKMRYLDDPVFDAYPYWIAHYYVEQVEYKGAWLFWQHTDAGHLPGIKGDVDFNIFNGTFYELRQLTIGGLQQTDADSDLLP
ncbi:MAG: glycoside hydrolase family 25 protein [Prevotella sp.]|nr:glycoside hydrolase family 25 protein [Prevotella sp.]